MTDKTRPDVMRRTWRWIALAVLVVLAVAAAIGWLFRLPIAEALGQRACAQRGLHCAFDVTGLQPGSATLEAVSLSAGPGEAPLTADRVELELAWNGIVPRVEAILVDEARVAATFDGSRFSLGGLESALGTEQPASPSGLPAIEVRNGKIDLSTPAGALQGDFEVRMADIEDGRLRARLQPATLVNGEDRLTLISGELDLTLRGGRMAGIADLEVEEGGFGDFSAASVLLRAEVTPAADGDDNTIDYRLAAQELSYGAIDVRAATSNGSVILDGEGLTLETALGAVRLASGTFEADTVSAPGLLAEGLVIDLDLTGTRGSGLEGPLALTARGASFAGLGSSGALALTGDLARLSPGTGEFQGQATVRNAALAPEQVDRLEGPLTWPAPARGHGAALLETLAAALADFDTGTRVRIARSTTGTVQIQARGATRLTSQTGLTLAVRPFGEGPWLESSAQGVNLRGALALGGGGAPNITTQIEEASLSDGSLTLRLGELDLADWSVEGATLGAGLSRLEAARGPGRFSLTGQGAVRFDGPLGRAGFRDLNLFGAIDAVRGSEGWRAQLGGGRCLSLAFDQMALPGIELGALTTSLCPEDGRIARQGEGASSGTLSLDAISVPISLGQNRGALRLPASRLDWSLGERVRADLALTRMALDLTTGPRELLLSAGNSNIGVLLEDAGLEATGRLRNVVFGGSLIPANASASRFDFRLRGGDRGLSGTADIASVRVSDHRSDPLYKPMVADLSAELLGGVVQLIGPVRLEATGRHVADTDIRVALPAVDGMIRVTSRDLVFRPGELQPSDLSERLRGFFTDTRGALDAEARIAIDKGQLSGTGDLTVSDLGFQTVALGRVSSVDGGVFFSDLLALRSPPGQTVTIGSIDPGLPLENGTVSFQLTGGGDATLEEALWPFAGGVLAVEPTRWLIGAQSRRLTVRADRIGLSQLTDLLALPGFDAEGTVAGRFPIVFRPGHVDIVNAQLVADSRGGVLRYTGGVGAQAGQENENVATAFRALENFQFTVLELGADGDLLGDVTVSARLEGRNPDVLDGSPFNFNVSIDSKLGQLLTSARRLSGPDWLAEVRAEQAGSSPP